MSSSEESSDDNIEYIYGDTDVPYTKENMVLYRSFQKLLLETIDIPIMHIVDKNNHICSSHDSEKMIFKTDWAIWQARDDGKHDVINDRFLTIAEYIFGSFPFQPDPEKIQCDAGDEICTFRMTNIETKFFLQINLRYRDYFEYGIGPFSYHNEGLHLASAKICDGMRAILCDHPAAVKALVVKSIEAMDRYDYNKIKKLEGGAISFFGAFDLLPLTFHGMFFRIVFPTTKKRKAPIIISVALPDVDFTDCIIKMKEGWKRAYVEKRKRERESLEEKVENKKKRLCCLQEDLSGYDAGTTQGLVDIEKTMVDFKSLKTTET